MPKLTELERDKERKEEAKLYSRWSNLLLSADIFLGTAGSSAEAIAFTKF